MNSHQHSLETGRPRWGVLLALLIPLNMAADELSPLAGELPPVLSLPDLSGKTHDLGAYRGEVVLVNFWASWCSPCLTEMPGMRRLTSAMKNRPFRILAVNVGENKSQVWRFSELLDLNFPAILDSNGEAARSWQVSTFPTSYIIDAEGRIRHRVVGAEAWDSKVWEKKIDALMPDIERQ